MNFSVLEALTALGLGGVLLWVAIVDIREYRLPDVGVLPLIPAGLLLSFWSAEVSPMSAALGAVIGFVVFYSLGEFYFRSRGVEGLGIGDAKLLSAAGAWLGASALPFVVLFAAIPAIGLSIITGRQRLAFGPYLAAAFFLIWLWSGR